MKRTRLVLSALDAKVADTVELSSKTRTLYLVFNYENGPMFGATWRW